MSIRQITHVAIQYSGKVHSLPKPNRHHHVIRMMGGCVGPNVQGFLDDQGVFLGRKEAYKVAMESGQIDRSAHGANCYQGDQLFSEDLW